MTPQEAQQLALAAFKSANSIHRQLALLAARPVSWLDALSSAVESGIDIPHFDAQLAEVAKAVKQHGSLEIDTGTDLVSIEGAHQLLKDAVEQARRLG